MAAVHTDAPAIFGGYLVNEAEEKIQYVKLRPNAPYDSKTPITFLIPGNTAQYVSLRDSLLYIECHIEETDRFGKIKSSTKSRGKRSANEINDDEIRAKKRTKRTADPEDEEEEEEDYDGDDEGEIGREKRQALPSSVANQGIKTNAEIADLLDEAQEKWSKSVDAWTEARMAVGSADHERLETLAEGLEDLAVLSLKQYLKAKRDHREIEGLNGAIVPVDNVMHSMWNGMNIFMNGEQVSTTNQKYMYKSFIETLLNNSATTKQYQLENSGFFGDKGNKDMFFNLTFNKGMEKRYMHFRDKNKVEMMGFLMSDMAGIQASIINGVEISIELKPNQDNIRLQCFGEKKFGALIIDNIRLLVCKKQMTKEVMLAHAELLQKTPAVYPFKKSEIRAYNGNKGQTEIVIENPYESKVPTRFIVGMVDADAYIGNFSKNPLNFKHYNISRAAFSIDDEHIGKPPYSLDPLKGKFIEPLLELHSILGKAGEDSDIGITPEQFLNGLFLLPFDVKPTAAANMEYLSIKECGNCRLELQFREALPNNIVVLTYAIFPMELQIDAARNCKVVPV